jgi:hypothetical protein
MPHAEKGHFGQRGLCGVLNHETIDVELTGHVAAVVRRERRITTGCLAPATGVITVMGSDLCTTMLVRNAV